MGMSNAIHMTLDVLIINTYYDRLNTEHFYCWFLNFFVFGRVCNDKIRFDGTSLFEDKRKKHVICIVLSRNALYDFEE